MATCFPRAQNITSSAVGCCLLLLLLLPLAALPSEQQPPPSAETTTRTLDYHGKHEPLLTSSPRNPQLSSLANHALELQPFPKEPK